MKIYIILAGLLLSFPQLDGLSQVFLYEGFETGDKPEGWTEEVVVYPAVNWRYRNGGYNPSDPNLDNPITPNGEVDIARNPPAALEGNYNAFFFNQGTDNNRTKLITPELDLLGASAVKLSFYLCQMPWTFVEGSTGWDVLRIYYKVSLNDPWVLLEEYLDPITEWEKQTVNLPNPTETYYVGFEGHARWGFGTLVDSVLIEETGIQQLNVNEILLEQPLLLGVPSGTSDAPVLRADVKVYGNSGTLSLNQITFTSLNTSDSDISANGVKLYSTPTQAFDSDTPLGSPTSFSNGKATFTALNRNLSSGHNYFWLAYDVDQAAKHKNKLDAMIAANDVVTSGGTYPTADQSPSGERSIYYTHYFDDFEGAQNWVLTGEFEIGTPAGLGGSNGNPDPIGAFSGIKSIGTDLTGDGDYEPNLTASTADMATSESLNMLYYKDLNLFFRRYLNIDPLDYASIEISSDDGITWEPIWESSAYVDFQWDLEKVAIPSEYWRSDSMKIRFSLGPTSDNNNYSGWNIDDVSLTGEFISKDVGVSAWISPQSGSGLTTSESVTIRIRNYGGAAITDPVPVAYSFNGGSSWTIDQMDTDIPVDGSVEFTFPTKTNLSQPGLRPSVIARTLLPGDQFSGNDQIATEIYVVPTYTPPHHEDFEETDGFWRAFGSEIWEFGTPDGTVINSAASGSKSWATGLSTDYGDMISESNHILFEDGFETPSGWEFTGEFERASPQSEHLPWVTPWGFYCIGIDLTGRPDSLYKYENGITELSPYTATSPALDVSEYSKLQLSFARWITVQAGDTVKLEISSDNGSTWHPLWQNEGAEIMDTWWTNYVYDIPDQYIFTDAFRFRFALTYSSLFGEVAQGWSVDEVLLTGDLVSSQPAYLSSPSFDLSGVQNPMITAKLWIDSEEGTDGANLQYSLDDGANWANVTNPSGYDAYWNWYTGQQVDALESSGWSGQSGDWITVKHLLPGSLAGESNVQFRFTFAADKVQNQYNGIAVDDVKVMEAPHDADLLSIVYPESDCELSNKQKFTLTIQNSGISTIQAGDSLRVAYYIDHPERIQTAEEVFYLPQNVTVGNTLDITTGSEFDFSASGEYLVTVYLQYNDPHFYSPVSSDTIYSMIEVEKPFVELGGIISTAEPDTVILKAFSGVGGQSYLWQDSSTDSVFNVSTNGTYWVQVSNTYCSASDTIKVVQLFPDVGVTAYLGSQSGCEAGPGFPLEVSIKNLGNDTLEIGNKIIIGGIINSGEPFYDTVTLAQRFRPAEQFNHIYTGSFDFSAPGTYQMRLFTEMSTDENPVNDTLYYNLEVYGYPDASLGEDVTINAMEYVLAPEAGNYEYLWQDGSTGETFTVNQPGTGTYHVSISNENLCMSYDTIEVTLNVTDLELSQLLSPAGACEFSTSITIAAMVSNQGNQTLSAGQSVTMGYSINEGTVITEQTNLVSDLLPGEHFDFSFSGTETFLPDQWYLFTVFVDYGTDVNHENDTITSLVRIFDSSPVDLGRDRVETGLQYTLDAGPDFVSYLWQDASTNETYTITSPGIGIYHVSVEDQNGCTASDTVRIMLSVPDIGVTEILHPQTSCQLKNDEHVQVAVQNFGNWPLSPTSAVYVNYVVNGGPVVTEFLVIEDSLKNGELIYHTFSADEDFGVPGNYNIVAWTTYADDLFPGNDDATVNIDHYGPVLEIRTDPEFELDADTLGVTGPVTLYAYQPYSSFPLQWHDGSSDSSYVIGEPSADWYWVMVEGEQCITRDSLFVAYDRPDLEITDITSPMNSCAQDQLTYISMEIVNNGYLDITTDEDISITYSVNGETSVFETINFSSNLNPGQSVVISFTEGYDFSSPDTYQLNLSLLYSPDENLSNNVISSEITIWANPTVEIGGGEDTLRSGLPITLDAGSGFNSYLWQDNFSGSAYEVNAVGLYWVEVRDNNNCADRDSVFVNWATGIDDNQSTQGKITLYPNPASDILNVDIDMEVEKEVIVEMYSILNKLVYRQDYKRAQLDNVKIDVNGYTPGTYFLRILIDETLHTRLVVVE